MGGLALMAWGLAYRRVWNWPPPAPVDELPAPRHRAALGGAQTEYYAIIDRLTRGEKP